VRWHRPGAIAEENETLTSKPNNSAIQGGYAWNISPVHVDCISGVQNAAMIDAPMAVFTPELVP